MEKLKVVAPDQVDNEQSQESTIRSLSSLVDQELPKRYRGKTCANLVGQDEAVESALKVVSTGRSVFITGEQGRGKTHLGVGLARALIESGRVPLSDFKFLPSVEFFLELKEAMDSKIPERDIIAKYAYVTLLVFDDIGAEKISDWSRQVFYTLIDRRYRSMLQTIITSNKSLGQIAELIDDRISSRIVEMGAVIQMEGEDWRLKAK